MTIKQKSFLFLLACIVFSCPLNASFVFSEIFAPSKRLSRVFTGNSFASSQKLFFQSSVYNFQQVRAYSSDSLDRSSRTRWVLSLDGGGGRCILQTVFLEALEQNFEQPISEKFDVISGTSTGGFLALSLATPDKNGKPKYSATALKYKMSSAEEGMIIDLAKKSVRKKEVLLAKGITSALSNYEKNFVGYGIWHAGMTDEYSNKFMKHHFLSPDGHDTKLEAALTNLVIPSFSLTHNLPFIFSSRAGRTSQYPMEAVARATFSALSVLPTAEILGSEGGVEQFVDGGLYINSPSLLALAEAKRLYPDDVPLIVSLGTGRTFAPIISQDSKNVGQKRGLLFPVKEFLGRNQLFLNRGVVYWLHDIAHISAKGVSQVNDSVLEKLQNVLGYKYLRYDVDLVETPAFANPEVINELKCIGCEHKNNFLQQFNATVERPLKSEGVAPNQRKKIKVLCLDGGGIRGIIAAVILARLESRIQERAKIDPGVQKKLQERGLQPTGNDVRVAHFFDHFAGTSTGGIITLGLNSPDHRGIPKLTAQEIVEIYKESGRNVFPSDSWLKRKWRKAKSALRAGYSADPLKKLITDIVGDETNLQQTFKPVLIAAYDVQNDGVFVFNSQDPSHTFKVSDVALSTSAAPTFFPIAEVSQGESGPKRYFVDGGVCINNPSLIVLRELLTEETELDILSIGTGHAQNIWKGFKDCGIRKWGDKFLNFTIGGVAESNSSIMSNLASSYEAINYRRIQINIPEKYSALDKSDNIPALERITRNIIEADATQFKEAKDDLRLSGFQENAKTFDDSIDEIIDEIL